MEYFFTKSKPIQEIIKGFNLTKTLFVSSILIGEANIGKKSLIRSIFPETPLVSGKNQEEVVLALESYDELIITDFEKLNNQNNLDFSNKRIIATANYLGNTTLINELFAFIYTMPTLNERPKDVIFLRNLFLKDAQETLMIENNKIELDSLSLDLSSNSKSLKKSIYMHLAKYSMTIDDIQDVLHSYLYKHLEGQDGYKKYLGLYEKPLIEAGLKKYGSQLQLAQTLGINRNTLRKKIHEHNIDQL